MPATCTRRMVTPMPEATVDQFSDAERRGLLHYLEQTVGDDFALTDEWMAVAFRKFERFLRVLRRT